MSEVGCTHNSYWRGVYGTCMACRAEQAEAALARVQGALNVYLPHKATCGFITIGGADCDCGALQAALEGRVNNPHMNSSEDK